MRSRRWWRFANTPSVALGGPGSSRRANSRVDALPCPTLRCGPLTTEALVIRLEFARTEDAGDPHAFHTGPQDYLLRWPDGAFEPARLIWNDELLHELAALRSGHRDPELVRRLGDQLQRFLAPTRFAGLSLELRAAVAAGRPARLEILAAAAELYTLPWELLTQGDGRTLGELPKVGYRQWVLSFGGPLAVRLGYDQALLAAVAESLARALMQDMRASVKERHGLASVEPLHAGVFTVVPGFG